GDAQIESAVIGDEMVVFFFQAEDGIRDGHVTGVQTCALPIYGAPVDAARRRGTPGVAGTCGRTGGSREREAGRPLPAARPADHDAGAVAERAAAAHAGAAAAASRSHTAAGPTRPRAARKPARAPLD